MIDVAIACFGIAFLILIIYEIKAIPKLIKLTIESKKIRAKADEKYEYFRDIPNEKASPAEAVFVKETRHEPIFGDFTKVFSATILSLAMKGYYEIKVKESDDRDKNGMVYFEFSSKFDKVRGAIKYHIDEKQKDLTDDENLFLEYLLKVAEDRDKMPVNNLKAYAMEDESNKTELIELIEGMQTKVIVSERINGNINTEADRQMKKLNEEIALNMGIIGLILTYDGLYYKVIGYYFIIIFLISFLFMILPGINIGLLKMIKFSLPYLSNKGLNEKAKWKGLEKYLKDYTLIDERKSITLPLYEKYLVYGTAFGISREALKELSIFKTDNYKDIEVKDVDMNIEENISDTFESFEVVTDNVLFIVDDLFRTIDLVFDVMNN
ncbi:MAG: DUF2207 domain-containing protein [Clostridia bacterium]|nr:DUF2207 domain-containing protein [Clostridia bacterium]